VVRGILVQWCINVISSKVQPINKVTEPIRNSIEGIVAWVQTRQTSCFVENVNGLFQAAKRRVSGYGCTSTLRTVIFLIAGKLKFAPINPHAA
jgi:hypothetical protein